MRQMKMQTPGGNRALGDALLAGKTEITENFKLNSSVTIIGAQQKRGVSAAERLRSIAELDQRHAEERRALILNLLDLAEADERQQKLQAYAAQLRGRFSSANWVDAICSMFGWRLAGPGCLDLGIDDDQVDYGCSIDWARPGDDDCIVSMELGDEPALLVSDDGGNAWRMIEVSELCDVLGDWTELQASGACMRGAA